MSVYRGVKKWSRVPFRFFSLGYQTLALDSKKDTRDPLEGIELHRRVSQATSPFAPAAIVAIDVVLISVAAGLASEYPDDTGVFSAEIIYEGDCALAGRWNTAIHILTNALSTGILAAKNHCMQALVVPTRADLDYYHAQGRWLDIGTPSWRNLNAIKKWRRWCWLVLLVITTPFHLLYNSAMFKSQATGEYSVILAPADLNLAKNLTHHHAGVGALLQERDWS
ncbi:hypothetical protein BDW74DRAFT_183803 [Aspergillus multicolor]|uniref:uncharacterized protein n=1 Tax=Aspergillus multicolor TaxID=41759 RepID=UPI003CCD5ACF